MIAQICFTNSFGGLEMTPLKLQKTFNSMGFPGVIFCLKGSPIEKAAREMNLQVVTFPKAKYFSPSVSLKLRRELRRLEVQVVFVHHLRDLWLLRPALIGLKTIKVFGFAHMFLKNINKKDLLHRWVYSPVVKMITTTKIQTEYLKKCLPLKDDQYVVIPYPIDVKRFSPKVKDPEMRKHLGAQEGDTLIGLVGRIDPWKGQEEFLQAAVKLLAENKNLHFVMVGDPTPDQPEFFKKITHILNSNSQLQSHVSLVPFRKDVENVFNALDIFVMPSWEETFGIVLIEAMACALPVISTRAGGVPEIIDQDEVVGKLIEPKSAESLYSGIKFYLDDKSRAQKIAQQARESVVRRYSSDVIIGEIIGPRALNLAQNAATKESLQKAP